MPGMIIKPWDFAEDETVELYWLGSPFRDDTGQWNIRALFKTGNGKKKDTTLPWAMLPLLTIGRKYIAGKPLNQSLGDINSLVFPSETRFDICKGLDLPYSLYRFQDCLSFGLQKLCRFTIDGNIYYIPCTEIIRAILAPYAALLHQILNPAGLDYFIDSYNENNGIYNISLNSEYPSILLDKDITAYFTWLYFNQKASAAWHSVYVDTYQNAVKQHNSPGNGFSINPPVTAYPPVTSGETWQYRGLQQKNHILILQLYGRSHIDHTCLKVNYDSPRLTQTVKDKNPVKPKTGLKPDDVTPVIRPDETEASGSHYPEPVRADIIMPAFSFHKKPEMNKVRSRIRKIHNGPKLPPGGQDPSGHGFPPDITGTLKDWNRDGDIRRIEFAPLECQEIIPPGFEDFIKVIGFIRKKKPEWTINMKFLLLQRKQYEPDTVRWCCVVRIDGTPSGTVFLIELSYAFEMSVSTLIIKPISSYYNLEEVIIRILKKLTYRIYHWDVRVLKEIKGICFYFSRHITFQALKEWADRITKKI